MIKTKSADDPCQCNIINLMLEHLLPPATKLGQGYVFTRVCDFCSQEGVCLSACWDTHPPPGKDPPWQGTPPLARHTPPRAVHAGRYGQQAFGMHPTGMQFLSSDALLKVNEAPQVGSRCPRHSNKDLHENFNF